jgi:signal transduction histidine kinase
MRFPLRMTVRHRLTLLMAGLIVVTGVALMAASYELVRTNLNSAPPGSPHTPRKALVPAGQQTSTSQAYGYGLRQQIAHHTLGQLLVQYGAILGGLVVIGGLLAWLIAGQVLRPLRVITGTAKRINQERLDERLALAGPRDELKELGDTFDAMLARLQAAFQNQQLFAANAAHELRTPLAVMRAELDLALTGPQLSQLEQRELTGRLRRVVLACEELIERLLTLTRGTIAPGDRRPVRIDEVARRLLPDDAQNVTVRTGLNAANAYGDAALIGQLISNLIENAAKYNCPGGWISVTTQTENHKAVVEVANSGPELSSDEVPGLLEPFRRASRQRVGNSTGLGLSIVRAIVDAHGGELSLTTLVGGGLKVTASFPAAPDLPRTSPC